MKIEKSSGKKNNPGFTIGYKLKGKELAKSLGIKTAETYGAYKSIDDVKPRDSFITKPTQGCSCRGVFPLVKKKDKYLNLFNNELKSWNDWKVEFKKGNHAQSLWTEELLNPLPFNWKFYTFNGKIGLITQYILTGSIYLVKYWWNWECINKFINPGSKKYIKTNGLEVSQHITELEATAIKLSKEIKYPFVRVDLYETKKGIYFGELTPHPGAGSVDKISDYYDNAMGEMWEEAEKELGIFI